MNDENNMKLLITLGIDKTLKELDNLDKGINKTVQSMGNLENGIKRAFNSSKIIAFTGTIKAITNTMINASKKQTEYIENLNLLQVAYGETNSSGEQLIETLNQVIGLDQSGLTKFLGTFRQMSSALGITNENANLLSENLLKMQLDISSLYNLDFERAGKILQVTLSGNTKSIRALGGDITEASLQQTAWNLGIEKTIDEMNRAEKTMLIYLTIERQLSNANGDMAKTVNSVANQTKIFREQLFILSRQIGAVFIPVLQTVLPILNGILMALNEIAKMILSLLGIDASSISSGLGNFGDEILDLEDGLNGVSNAAKAAKQSLRGFDKLNVIKTPTSSSSGTGGGIGTGIDNKILEQLKQYDLHLDSIKNKATKIKNQILKTLGFTQELNEETGQWEWEYQGLGATVKGLWEWFKKLNPMAKLFVGFITALASYKLIKGVGSLFKTLGNTTFLKSTSNLISSIFTNMKGMTALRFGNIVDSWSAFQSIGEKISSIIVGTGGIVVGLNLINDSLKNIKNDGIKGIEAGIGTISTLVGGFVAGSSIGGIKGGIIGLTISGALAIVTALDTIDTAMNTNQFEIDETYKKVHQLYTDWNALIEENNEKLQSNTTENNYYQKLWNELQSIVDQNGKIKEGYEDRAKTIIEILNNALDLNIEVIDNTIQKYGELGEKIDEVIQKREAELKLSVLEEEYKTALEKKEQALKNQAKAYNELQTAQDNYNKAIKNMSEIYEISEQDLKDWRDGLIDTNDIMKKYNINVKRADYLYGILYNSTKKQKNALDDANQSYKEASEVVFNYEKSIASYEHALELMLNGQYEALNTYVDHERHLLGASLSQTDSYWQDVYDTTDRNLKELEKNKENYDEKDYERIKNSFEQQRNMASQELETTKILLSTSLTNMGNDVVEKWKEMGETSVEKFENAFNQLPNDVKYNLAEKLRKAGFQISEELQNGIDSNSVTVKLNADVEQFTKTINSQFGTVFKALGIKAPSLGIYAEGGFPDAGLFVAREHGNPEMIGTIGRKPAVANNDQIVESISQGVYRAMKSANGGKQPIIIEADSDTEGLLKFISFKQKERKRQFDF